MSSSKSSLAARTLLGLIFFVFGLNGFLGFIPQPPLTGGAASFMGSLAETGYMLPLIKGTEVLAGAALLAGVFVPLALIVLAPIVLNIAMFHFVLAPANLVLVFALLGLGGYLAWSHRQAFAPLFQAKFQAKVQAKSKATLGASKTARHEAPQRPAHA